MIRQSGRPTPGPWIVASDYHVIRDDFENIKSIAYTANNSKTRTSEAAANARFIAAAPDVFATLKAALEDSGCDGDLCAHGWHEAARKLISRIEEDNV